MRFKPPGRETLQGFLDNGGERFVAHHHLAFSAAPLKFVPIRRMKHPIAVHGAGAHPVLGLLGILLALVLRDGRQQVLDKLGVAVLAELNGGAL
nr:hypothetical protein [Parvularcula marina]